MGKPKNGKSKDVDENVEIAPVVLEDVEPPEPKFLTEDALYLWKVWEKEDSPRNLVPPQTPNSEYDFSNTLHPFPTTFPELDALEVPYVRDKGVRFCIDALGEYFGCKDYRFNLLQFWFLDVLTDCLWIAQDDFRLPVDQQKIVLTWILYLIDLVKDPQKNLSRKKFFTIFKEVMLVAAEVIDEGCETVPMPQQLFALVQEEEKSESWSSSDSASTSTSLEIDPTDFDNTSCVELEIDQKRRRFLLPEQICDCAKYDLSSVDSIPESDSLSKHTQEEETKQEFGEEEEEKLEDIEFYQPDPNVPLRFLPFQEEEGEVEAESVEGEGALEKSMCKIEEDTDQEPNANENQQELNEENAEDRCHVYEVPDKFCINRTSGLSESTKDLNEVTESSTSKSEEVEQNQQGVSVENENKTADQISVNTERELLLEKFKEKQILKGLAFQKLWEQRLKDMDKPRKGWIPTGDDIEIASEKGEAVEEGEEEQSSEEPEASDDEDWADIVLEQQKEGIQKEEDKLIVNFGVLRTIIDFVFKYFYESFQFSLIKLAFQATPEIISQNVNEEWKIPKKIKEELQKPKVEKEKKTKEKKGKKDKSSKSSKKDKKKDKKKDSKKKDKSSKKSDKSKKDKKKEKKQKPVKLTKEQKAELERQRKEQARIEEELRKLEENKRFVFPLTDAATDELFKGIFENWVKVDLTKKGKDKKDKGKKGKKK